MLVLIHDPQSIAGNNPSQQTVVLCFFQPTHERATAQQQQQQQQQVQQHWSIKKICTNIDIRRGDDVSTIFFSWPLLSSICLCKKTSLRVRGYVHSVTTAFAIFPLIGTRITYQDTEDAGSIYIHRSTCLRMGNIPGIFFLRCNRDVCTSNHVWCLHVFGHCLRYS